MSTSNNEEPKTRYSLVDTGVYSLEDAWAESFKMYGAVPRSEIDPNKDVEFAKISQKHRNAVMEALFKAKKPFNNTVQITKSFYKTCGYSMEIVESSLNYLSAKGYIDLIPPDMERHILPRAELKAEAYTYFPDLKDRKFKFWLPLIVSLAVSLASLVISIIAIVLQL